MYNTVLYFICFLDELDCVDEYIEHGARVGQNVLLIHWAYSEHYRLCCPVQNYLKYVVVQVFMLWTFYLHAFAITSALSTWRGIQFLIHNKSYFQK